VAEVHTVAHKAVTMNLSIEQKGVLYHYMHEMRRIAVRVGPQHSWWDYISEMNSLVERGHCRLFTDFDELIDDIEIVVAGKVEIIKRP
jgi:hypothetical protein